MKVTRYYIGKVCQIKWKDPAGGGKRAGVKEAKSGRAALGTWEEWGLVDEVVDGVVRMWYCRGYDPGEAEPDEGIPNHICEDLIEEIKVMVPEGQAGQKSEE